MAPLPPLRALKRAVLGPDPDRYTARTSDGWDIALHRYPGRAGLGSGAPVFLCHGLGANRFNLDAPGELSFARWLNAAGYDCWIVELRGAGMSSKPRLTNRLRYTWNFDDYVKRDIPAALELVRRETGRHDVHWVGHSMGGMVAYGYAIQCARDGLDPGLRSITAVGSPSFVKSGYRVLDKVVKLRKLLKLLPRVPYGGPAFLLAPGMPIFKETFGRIFGNPRNLSTIDLMKLVCVVPSDLPPTLIEQFADWIAERGFGPGEHKTGYADELNRIVVPSLIVAGPVDVITPPSDLRHVHSALSSPEKRFELFGKSTGCKEDYGHIDLILGVRAREEVWPHIRAWIDAH